MKTPTPLTKDLLNIRPYQPKANVRRISLKELREKRSKGSYIPSVKAEPKIVPNVCWMKLRVHKWGTAAALKSNYPPSDPRFQRGLTRLAELRDAWKGDYEGWYVAIDPDSGVYMVEKDLTVLQIQVNRYFPKTCMCILHVSDDPRIGQI